MGRILKNKELTNTRLAANCGGWMYCTSCGTNIGYLCYQTYDSIEFNYTCLCGGRGSAILNFQDSKPGTNNATELLTIKNRLCCPKDNEPLITILDPKLSSYNLKITCKSCTNIYHKVK